MRLVFAGTGAFAVPTLRALQAAGHDLALAVTQPDRPAGRGLQVQGSPVKRAAAALGLEVDQPARIGDAAALRRIAALRPEALVVAAYGQILPAALLAVARVGAINVHASLLPRHRGPAPIAWAILLADRETGVTIMRMDAGVDTGPILAQERVLLAADETTPRLEQRLADLGGALLVRTLAGLEAGTVQPLAQPAAGATYARRLTAADGNLDADLTAPEMDRRVRALTPEPGCWITLGRERVKVLRGQVATGQAGERGHRVPTRDGDYLVSVIVPPGRKPMAVEAYLRGVR